MNPFQSYASLEDPEARVIRIVTETLLAHRASRKTRGETSPLNDQDQARLTLLAEFRRGPYQETVEYLIREAFSDPDGVAKDGTPRPIDPPPQDAA